MWFLWLLVFVCLLLVLLLLMRCSIIDAHMRQINSFISNAVTTEEMQRFIAAFYAKQGCPPP